MRLKNHLSRLSIYLLAFLAALPLCAQLDPPQGWKSQSLTGGVLLLTPGEPSNSLVSLLLLPAGRPQGDTNSWFAAQTQSLAQAGGQMLSATQVENRDGMLQRTIQIENQKHAKVRILYYGYPTRNGISITVLAISPRVQDGDPLLAASDQYVHSLAARKFEIVSAPTPAAQPPASQAFGSQQPARNANGQYVGAFGRSDIDLTYHAKGIPSAQDDVPLKGVYLFAGMGFGATYGGVGTQMTWGQHAVQQLLLLFANGVAAKVDAKGGNLAGKYQAEGFATMDVANPAVVSGAPYGRWSDDGSVLHIQWNNGAPLDLAHNGESLDGNGQHWTPYHIPDGELIEGTFVRQMEAGLRSQAIVLHRDGTFQGDGVNVTMGGAMVSPRFPERGFGRYEIRKGSMILYFANGFTQSIACVLDPINTSDVRTVLLNGFPFTRVR
jgi:hypothetical protein